MRVDVPTLDRHIRFLTEEASLLMKNYRTQTWAASKAKHYEEIAELLRQERQDQQMTGVGGKRIDE